MSRRHTTSRRRSYGRRQHELHERTDRRTERRTERAWRLGHEVGLDGMSLEHHATETPFGFAD
jgi:hypothetical protein